MKDLHDVIKRPILTEKSYNFLPPNTYAFEVELSASKPQIRDAVEGAFDVEVKCVRTVRNKGKLKRQGRTQGMTPRTKKAYVTLREDSKGIPFFENMMQ